MLVVRPPIEPRSSPPLVDLGLLLTLSTLWGASYTFIRIGVATIPPLTLMAARTLVAGSLLAAWIVSKRLEVPRDAGTWRRFAVQALLNSVVPFTLIAWAERSVDAGLATILNAASPILVFVVTWVVARHERVDPRKLLGVVAGLVGIGLIVGEGAFGGVGGPVVAQVAIVVATACYAAAALYGHAFRGLPAVLPAAGSLLVGATLLVPASLVVDRPWTLHPSGRSLVALLALSVFSTALAFVIYFRLIRTLSVIGTTAQAYLRVPIGTAIGIVFLGESLTSTAWLGLACVVVGVAAMTMPARPASRRR